MKTVNLFVLLLIFGTTSCTIQKRVFLPGYDIQWKNKSLIEKKEVKESLASEELTEEQRETAPTYDYKPTLIQEAELKDSLAENIGEKPVSYENKQQVNGQMSICELYRQNTISTRLTVSNHKLTAVNTSNDKEGYNLFSILALSSSLVYVLFLVLLLKLGGELLIGLMLAFLALTVVMAIGAFKTYRNKPDKRKGTFLAIIALAIVALGLLVLFGYIVTLV